MKEIKGFENYGISIDGTVTNIVTGKQLKHDKTTKGYAFVTLYKDKKRYTKYIHRLLAEAFIPNPNNLPEIDHINAIRDDNSIDNLRWVSRKDNIKNPLTIDRITKKVYCEDKNGNR